MLLTPTQAQLRCGVRVCVCVCASSASGCASVWHAPAPSAHLEPAVEEWLLWTCRLYDWLPLAFEFTNSIVLRSCICLAARCGPPAALWVDTLRLHSAPCGSAPLWGGCQTANVEVGERPCQRGDGLAARNLVVAFPRLAGRGGGEQNGIWAAVPSACRLLDLA